MTPLEIVASLAAAHTGPACLPFEGGHDNGKGYRILRNPDPGATPRTLSAHRLAWQAAHGVPVPVDAQVDHLCHNLDLTCEGGRACPHRACINPAHLAARSPQANTLAGRTPAAANAAKIDCDHGHPLEGPNLFLDRKGYRQCLECKRDRQRRYDQARRADNVARYGRTRTPAGATR